jgi:hypothetical protein
VVADLKMYVWKYRWIVVDAGSIMIRKSIMYGKFDPNSSASSRKMNRKVVKTSLEGGKMDF